MAAQLKPDLLLVDIVMPVLNGLDAVQFIKQNLPPVKVVFLTMNNDPEVAAEAFRCGASAYLVKTCAATELVKTVRHVLHARTYCSPGITRDTIKFLRQQSRLPQQKEQRLTERERDVLRWLAEGGTMREIAHVTGLNTDTCRVLFFLLQRDGLLLTDLTVESFAGMRYSICMNRYVVSARARDWRELYKAAIFETDRTKLPSLIDEAEKAITLRGQALLTVSRHQVEEADTLDDALYALRALRSSLHWRTFESRVA